MQRNLAMFLGLPLAFCLLLPQASPAAPSQVRLPPISVRVLPGTDPSILDDLENVRPVKGAGPAALQLDLAHKQVLNASGAVVVEAAGSNPMYLQGIVDKWRYIESLTALADAHPQEMHLVFVGPREAPHRPEIVYSSDDVVFVVSHVSPQRQLLVFNISPVGTIQTLYVRDQPDGSPGDTVNIEANASAPFGADHVIAVSAADPVHMRNLIGWMQEAAQARGMIDTRGAILDQITGLKDVRVGVVFTYTCLSAAKCAR
jgi:hypothetical protein